MVYKAIQTNKHCIVCKKDVTDSLFCDKHQELDCFKKITYIAKYEEEKSKKRIWLKG